MAGIEVSRVYPSSSKIARGSTPANHLSVLKTAVTELAISIPRRSQHIVSVAKALNAISSRDRNFFLSRLPESLIETEIKRQGLNQDVFTGRYIHQLEQLFDQYASLDQASKAILELAVWGHDLGVPFGIEWEHPWHGSEVIRELISDDSLARPVSALVRHHGEYSNLISSSFPRDIYQLPRDLQRSLLLLDFCDATARINREGEELNSVGLRTIGFYTSLIPESGLARLEDPEHLFELRCSYGFAPIIFNNPGIDQTTLDRIFETIARLNPDFDKNKFMRFFGSQFRCNFMDLMLMALEDPSAKADLFATIYHAYRNSPLAGDVLLWPDVDLGRLLGEDPAVFIGSFTKIFSQMGISEFLIPLPFRNQLLLLVSRLIARAKATP